MPQSLSFLLFHIVFSTKDRAPILEDSVRPARTMTTAKIVEELKTSSSKWLKTQSPTLTSFAWQRGYGAFSVGPTDLDALRYYIDNPEEHHRRQTFQEEYRAFLTKYRIEYDERYVWD